MLGWLDGKEDSPSDGTRDGVPEGILVRLVGLIAVVYCCSQFSFKDCLIFVMDTTSISYELTESQNNFFGFVWCFTSVALGLDKAIFKGAGARWIHPDWEFYFWTDCRLRSTVRLR